MKKIMIVDDDVTSLAIASALLEDEFDVTTAQSGISALGYIRAGTRPDLILLDMLMPGMSGMDVLKELKKDSSASKIPIIFLSNLDGMDFQLEGLDNGAADFIQKPIHARLLKLKIHRQLYIAQLEEEHAFLSQKVEQLQNGINQLFADTFDTSDS